MRGSLILRDRGCRPPPRTARMTLRSAPTRQNAPEEYGDSSSSIASHACPLLAGRAGLLPQTLSSKQLADALEHLGYRARVFEAFIRLERTRDGRVLIVDNDSIIPPAKLRVLLAAASVSHEELARALDRAETPPLDARPRADRPPVGGTGS